MSINEKNSIDFWPGYVDAMVNILLNLLFLAGIFTIGLVMFNAQSVLNKLHESLMKKEQRRVEKSVEKVTKVVELPKIKPLVIPKIKEEIKIEEPIKEFRFKRKILTKTISAVDTNSFQKLVYEKLGVKILSSFEFAVGEQNWSKELTLSKEVINNLQNGSMLVVMTDVNNPRLAKEAYMRILSLKTILKQKYQLLKTPEIRIVEHGLLGDESLLERNVFLVNLPNENK